MLTSSLSTMAQVGRIQNGKFGCDSGLCRSGDFAPEVDVLSSSADARTKQSFAIDVHCGGHNVKGGHWIPSDQSSTRLKIISAASDNVAVGNTRSVPFFSKMDIPTIFLDPGPNSLILTHSTSA